MISLADPCESSPCKNSGKCVTEKGQFKCECTLPYFGSTCENKRNPCGHNTCLNGGNCVPTKDLTNFTCSCQDGFQGNMCQMKPGDKFSIVTNKICNTLVISVT